jgi:GNAT superfamily N-acetyltransferase
MAEVEVRRVGAESLDAIEPLYRELHRHHLSIAQVPLVADPDLSWARRRAWYARTLGADGFIMLATLAGSPVGYATVELNDGPDDTWPVGARWAEVASLAVDPAVHRRGIGTRLLDAVDRELATLGIADLMISLLAGNDEARRFYERRGLRVGELVMWRVADPLTD